MTKTYENEEHEIMNMNLIKKAIARLQHSMKYTNASNSNDDQSRHKKQTTSSRDSQDLNLNDDVFSNHDLEVEEGEEGLESTGLLHNEPINSNSQTKERVMYIWSVPANGHLNPTLCFTNQLLLRLDDMKVDKIIFYSTSQFKQTILDLPNNKDKKLIEFRDYNLEKSTGSDNMLKLMMNFDTRPGTLFRVFQCFENSLKLASKHLFKSLLKEMYRERPVLILYDQALFFPKLALNLFVKKYNCPKPLHGCYVTTFLCAKGIYPLWSELNKMGLLGKNNKLHKKFKHSVVTIYDFFKYCITYYKTLWWDLGFSTYELMTKCDYPIGKMQLIDDTLNLVFVLPEVQPRLESFDSPNIKFVGPCVDESVRNKISKEKSNMDQYIDMIDRFLEKNAINKINSNDKKESILMRLESTGDNYKSIYKPIIYVSMGTVFNNENAELFTVLVEACKHYADDYAVIVSTGDVKTYEKYVNTSLNSDNILLVPHTPQVEILKRAHLFITHAGMNSVSEAVNYGVPIICLPLSGDQPFVAWRVADELGVGVRLQPDKHLTIDKVKTAIDTILNNPIYRERAHKFSVISKTYDGHRLACEHTVNFLKQNEFTGDHSSTDSGADSVFYSKNNSFSPSPSSISASSSKTASRTSLNDLKNKQQHKKTITT